MASKKQKVNNNGRIFTNQNYIILPVVILAIITWGLFWLYPNLDTFALAFSDIEGKFSIVNFATAWKSFTSQGAELSVGLKNTLLFFLVGLIINLPLTIIVCYFMFKKVMGFKAFRIIFYLPSIIPIVALTGVFKSFISVSGPLGNLCNSFGIIIPNEGLLATQSTAIPTILFYSILTGISGKMLIISGTMARIPTEVLEAAKIEGCGVVRELVQIIAPLIWPTIATLITLSFASIIGAGGDLVMLLQPDTQYGTETLHYWMFRQIRGGSALRSQYGLVAATGLILTVFLVPLITGVRKMMDKFTVEY